MPQVSAGDTVRFKELTLAEAAALRIKTDAQVGTCFTAAWSIIICSKRALRLYGYMSTPDIDLCLCVEAWDVISTQANFLLLDAQVEALTAMAAGKLSPAEAESQLKVRRLSLRRGMLLRVVRGPQCRAWSGQETAETAWQQAVELDLVPCTQNRRPDLSQQPTVAGDYMFFTMRPDSAWCPSRWTRRRRARGCRRPRWCCCRSLPPTGTQVCR